MVVDVVMPPLRDRAGGQTEASWYTGAELGSAMAFRQWLSTVQGGESN